MKRIVIEFILSGNTYEGFSTDGINYNFSGIGAMTHQKIMELSNDEQGIKILAWKQN